MKKFTLATILPALLFILVSCQQENTQVREVPVEETEPADVTGGMILTGDLKGREFTISSGDEVEKILGIQDAFDRMDAKAAWSYYADTIQFHTATGQVVPFTEADAIAFFDQAESIDWKINSLIPVRVAGTDIVKVIMDGNEVTTLKDGTVMRSKLLEIFTFRNGKIVEVDQWMGEDQEEM